ncbi:hypothetical protein BDN71DRAFT_1431620 [Pleurotus eryngii]|uniref:Uncharacterized protein n=1 Tax=Pleurotus eryngii TaxID=5323 RepID=A0A9P5ZUH5_PLEER|nr:hypothetical protein BDN71DRAFT_1431620 [Pleurotus eryngii]
MLRAVEDERDRLRDALEGLHETLTEEQENAQNVELALQDTIEKLERDLLQDQDTMGILALHLFTKYTKDPASAQVDRYIFHVGDVMHAHIRAMDAEAERDAIQIRMNTFERELREEREKVKALELEQDGEAAQVQAWDVDNSPSQVDVGSDEREEGEGAASPASEVSDKSMMEPIQLSNE